MTKPSTSTIVDKVEQTVNSVREASKSDYSILPRKTYDPTSKITRAEKQEAIKIMPRRGIPVKCTNKLDGENLKYRDYMWEYVEGVFENREVKNETFTFWRNPFPGDAYAEWSVPSNKLIAIPRWLAEHLNSRQYVQFDYVQQRDPKFLQADDFLETFTPVAVNNRTTFLPARLY